LEESLAKSQRARTKKKTRSIHAKIKNKRRDEAQKFTTRLVQENAAIFVGDVSSSKLTKTRMAKSVLDAGWSQLKSMLEYKSRWAGVIYEVVDERYSTQTCSECGSISDSSPKGIAGLRIRAWTCSDCGTIHARDVNAARNILAAGHCRLAGGISAL
jgi:IS605 OrfB family transposase